MRNKADDKHFIIQLTHKIQYVDITLIVSIDYILCISWIIKCLSLMHGVNMEKADVMFSVGSKDKHDKNYAYVIARFHPRGFHQEIPG